MRKEDIKQLTLVAVIVAALALWLFRGALKPDSVNFSNDGPLGQLHATQARTFSHIWTDLNWIGGANPAWMASGITCGFRAVDAFRGPASLVLLCVVGFPIFYGFSKRGFWNGVEAGLLAGWLVMIATGLLLAGLHFATGNEEFLGMTFGWLCLAFVAGFFFLQPPQDFVETKTT